MRIDRRKPVMMKSLGSDRCTAREAESEAQAAYEAVHPETKNGATRRGRWPSDRPLHRGHSTRRRQVSVIFAGTRPGKVLAFVGRDQPTCWVAGPAFLGSECRTVVTIANSTTRLNTAENAAKIKRGAITHSILPFQRTLGCGFCSECPRGMLPSAASEMSASQDRMRWQSREAWSVTGFQN